MAHWKDCLDPAAPTGRYLPWREVARATSISRTTAWRLQRRGEFPKPYPISPGRVGYLETEVEAWKTFRRVLAPDMPSPAGPRRTASAVSRADPGPAAPAAAAAEPLQPRPTSPKPARRRGPYRSEHAKAIAQQMRFDF